MADAEISSVFQTERGFASGFSDFRCRRAQAPASDTHVLSGESHAIKQDVLHIPYDQLSLIFPVTDLLKGFLGKGLKGAFTQVLSGLQLYYYAGQMITSASLQIIDRRTGKNDTVLLVSCY